MNFITNALKKNLNYQQASGESWSVFSFYGTMFSSLFFKYCIEYFKRNGLPIVFIDLEHRDKTEIIAEWSMSFLGQHKIYWCGDISTLDAAKKKYYLAFLKTYTGPHKIILFNDQAIDKASDATNSLEVPSHVDQILFKELFALFYNEEVLSEKIIKKIFALQQKITLDVACNSMAYLSLFDVQKTDTKSDLYFSRLIEKIVEPEQSLFVMSQHFFAQESSLFFKAWRAVEHDFPPEFWIAFWSEQLWQASLFVVQAKEAGHLGARKGINRLPFSFMQRDWKKYTPRELCAAHNFLYSVDYGLKNGHATHGLELFFEHFLQGTFAKK